VHPAQLGRARAKVSLIRGDSGTKRHGSEAHGRKKGGTSNCRDSEGRGAFCAKEEYQKLPGKIRLAKVKGAPHSGPGERIIMPSERQGCIKGSD